MNFIYYTYKKFYDKGEYLMLYSKDFKDYEVSNKYIKAKKFVK